MRDMNPWSRDTAVLLWEGSNGLVELLKMMQNFLFIYFFGGVGGLYNLGEHSVCVESGWSHTIFEEMLIDTVPKCKFFYFLFFGGVGGLYNLGEHSVCVESGWSHTIFKEMLIDTVPKCKLFYLFLGGLECCIIWVSIPYVWNQVGLTQFSKRC